MTKIYKYQNEETGEVLSLSEVAAARFFDNRDPSEWVFVNTENEDGEETDRKGEAGTQ